MKLYLPSQIFEKFSNVKFYKCPSNANRVVSCGRTVRQGKANSCSSRFSESALKGSVNNVHPNWHCQNVCHSVVSSIFHALYVLLYILLFHRDSIAVKSATLPIFHCLVLWYICSCILLNIWCNASCSFTLIIRIIKQ